MGLFSGMSILSLVELCYWVGKFAIVSVSTFFAPKPRRHDDSGKEVPEGNDDRIEFESKFVKL